MWTDPIVEETRREREAHAEGFGFDVTAICRELQRLQEKESERKLILPPEAPQQLADANEKRDWRRV